MKKKNIKSEYILITVAVLLLILSWIFILQFSGANKLKDGTIQAPKIIGTAFLTIDFGNGQKRAFEGAIVENETVVDALNQASKAGGFSIETFVANKEKSWHWYLNNQSVKSPLHEIILSPNDEILIKYAR